MSRFFAGTESDTDSSSEEEQIVRPQAPVYTFSDDEEEVKRVVRSAKEKRYEELMNIIKQIRNYKKIKDMSSMLTSFEELQKAYVKAAPVILKEESGQTPRFFIRCLSEMEDFIVEMWEDRDGRKNMNKNNSKSLASMRQKLRKYLKDFEEDIAKFKENPDQPDDEEEEEKHEPEADSDNDAPPTKSQFVKAAPKPQPVAKEESSDSDDDWPSDTDSSSDSSDDDESKYTSMRERFLKKTGPGQEDDEEKEKRREEKRKERKDKERRKMKRDEEEDGEGEWETVKGGIAIPSEKPKMFAKDAEIDLNLVIKKLSEIMAARGKKRTDRREQIELLHELQNVADQHQLGPAINAKIKIAIVSAIFDYNPKVSDAMKVEFWVKLLERMSELLDVLLGNPQLMVAESITEETENLETAPFKIRGCVLTSVERLDDEFTKLLKECDPHSNEYVERLKDEIKVSAIIDKTMLYLERTNVPSELCRIYLRKIEHLYYKFDPRVLEQKSNALPQDLPTSVTEMEKLCKFIYARDGTDRLRTRAILSHIYHHALHDNWFQARDLVLMSHLQETIQHSDPSTQILYNRTMAHLGLCAFRHANIKDAHNCLVDLMMTGKPKELLAQGLLPQRQHERSKEQEKIEKQRQMPFHMHINLELLECVYLVSAMLIEIPYMAAHEFDARRRMISKTFYQQLRSSERQNLVGPPESMREHVVAAAKAMRNGNWAACNSFIINDKMNAKVWDLFYQANNVREMLTKLIKEESLRTYLFTYSHVYDSISMATLANMFELGKPVVHSIISKMIINEELMASLDDPTQTVVMHRSEPSRLQSLALQLADKINNFVDSNERILETKQGNFFLRGGPNQGNFRGDRQNYRGGNNENWSRQRRDRKEYAN
ncbi:unnamed protein product [Brassicogethes aeneus]|uniref:Eukaryotic translation initiation factor 3 subunit C n=1 Tax=Brassicogethes aeneus TaxID=1431903 RepID=A0A9P0FCY4_BRAAE|nr:unnamed protein product [Brassicogethes aeneus]